MSARPKPNPRPARAPAFIAFRELRQLAAKFEKRSRVLSGLGRPEEGRAWGECGDYLATALNFLEGK